MAAALAKRIKNEDLLPLNIVTNSIANLQILSEVPLCKVVLTGGVYNANRRDFSGQKREELYALIIERALAVGTTCLHARGGCPCPCGSRWPCVLAK